MKNVLTVCSLLLITLFCSCLQDKCSSVYCENGICVDGSCACQFGYEGQLCDEPWYAKFLGSWSVDESTSQDTVTNEYQIGIQFNSPVDTFKVSGFAGAWNDIYCVRETSTSFKILEHEVDSATKLISGQGAIDNTLLKVTGVYTFKKNDIETIVNFTWVK